MGSDVHHTSEPKGGNISFCLYVIFIPYYVRGG
jgi:hypothetical protein